VSVAFRKIWRDLWKNKGRTLLVVMTIAVILSLVASWLPARGATRISVRESLAYE
jgi:ABC-type lipoprotein release transport system permease subunit